MEWILTRMNKWGQLLKERRVLWQPPRGPVRGGREAHPCSFNRNGHVWKKHRRANSALLETQDPFVVSCYWRSRESSEVWCVSSYMRSHETKCSLKLAPEKATRRQKEVQAGAPVQEGWLCLLCGHAEGHTEGHTVGHGWCPSGAQIRDNLKRDD